jgi:HK97 family phage major capsid protein
LTDFDQQVTRNDFPEELPAEIAREIIQALPEQSAALSLFRRVPMSRRTARLRVLDALPTAYWVNGDTGLKKTSKQAWAGVTMTVEELAVIVPIPEAVLDDEDFDVWGEVRPRVAEAMGAAIDLAVFFGVNKPASWPTAIVTAARAAGNDFTRGSISGQDITVDIGGEGGVMSLVEDDGFDVSGFAAHRKLKAAFRGLRDNEGQPILQSSMTDSLSSLYGEPVKFVGYGGWDADNAELVAGDFSMGVLGVRQDITTKLLSEAVLTNDADPPEIIYNLPQQDMVAMRFVIRLAFAVANPVTVAQPTAADRYPFAILEPVGYTS